MGGGNVALAVVLTALSSLITVFTIPLLLSWVIPFFLRHAKDVPNVPAGSTMLQLVRITVLPVAVGMFVRQFAPTAAKAVAGWLRPLSLIVLVGVIGFAVFANLEMVLQNLVAVGPAMWTLNIAATLVGLGLATAIRADRRDALTIAIEVGVHNATLAIFLTLTVLGSLPLAVSQNIYGLVMIMKR